MRVRNFILFLFMAVVAMFAAALFGGLVSEAAGFDGATGAKLGAALSALSTAARVFMPGLFLGRAFTVFPTAQPPAQGFGGTRIVSQDRALLDSIVQDCRENGLNNALPLPGYIRAEFVLGAAQNSIQFQIAANQQVPGQTQSPSENRLNVNDAFYPMHYGVFFSKYTTATASTRLRAPLYSFGNTVAFGATVAAEVNGAYNGSASLRVNDRVYFDSLDMLRFKNVGTAQQGLAVSTAASNNAYQADNWNGNDMFAYLPNPLVRLNGQYSNLFTVKFPGSLDFTPATDTYFAVLYLRGWLVQNAGTARVGR